MFFVYLTPSFTFFLQFQYVITFKRIPSQRSGGNRGSGNGVAIQLNRTSSPAPNEINSGTGNSDNMTSPVGVVKVASDDSTEDCSNSDDSSDESLPSTSESETNDSSSYDDDSSDSDDSMDSIDDDDESSTNDSDDTCSNNEYSSSGETSTASPHLTIELGYSP